MPGCTLPRGSVSCKNIQPASRPEGSAVPDVLIVQSDPAIRGMLRATLEMEGYTCEEADNGISAWNLLRTGERTYVVLLSDTLPDLGWHDLLLVVSRDANGAGRHAYVVTAIHSERCGRALATVPPRLPVALLALPVEVRALPQVVAQAARRIGQPLPVCSSRASRTTGGSDRTSTLTLRVTAARAGSIATIAVRTQPGAVLALRVRYSSGRTARSPMLRGPRCADAQGWCRWQWQPRTDAAGRATVWVSAEWNGQRAERMKRIDLTTRP
jgi:CheY-like chemotaxis protein